jgi:hypothetical protein
MSRMTLARSMAGAALALVLLCANAQAGTPFTIGTGAHPDLAMDAGGVAHVVWRERDAGGNYVSHYCQIPPGATACANAQTLGGPNPGLDDPLVVLGDAVYVLVPHYVADTVDVFTSTNGGASFTGPVTLSEASPSNKLVGTDYEDAVFGPGQSISLATWNPGQYFLNFPVPAAAGRVSAANFSTSFVYNFSVALNGATPITTAWSITSGAPTQFAFWTPSGPNLNDAASWSGPTAVAQGEDVALAGGPNGVFAMSTGNGTQSFPSNWEVRRFTGSGFGAPALVATGETSGCGSCNDLYQDSKGGLYAAWRGAGSTVKLATSADGGSTFTGPYEIVAEPNPVTIANLHVAAVPGGAGLVVYDENSDTGEIRAANLTATPPPPPVAGVAVNVSVVKGEVLVKLPAGASARQKGQGFVPLSQARQIPVGSTLDTRKGTVALTAAANSSGKTQVGQFTAGLFQILQARAARPVARLKLSGGSFSSCGKITARSARRKKLSRKTIRQVRGDAKGNFRTEGRYAAATVRGTAWTMSDRCDGTLTKVRRGVVVVRDRLARRTIRVRAGKSYLARAR